MRTNLICCVLAALLSGCVKNTPCTTDEQCPAGQVCSQQLCTAACTPACASGQVCDSGKCFDKDCSGTRCSDNAFCYNGDCTYHGCRDRSCPTDQSCVTGGACVNNFCGDTTCASGQVCGQGSTCQDSACYGKSCSSGQVCFSGVCHPKDCSGRSCGDSFCADDGYCKDCPKAQCSDQDECVEGSCQSPACVSNPSSSDCDSPCKQAGRLCTAGQVCINSTCVPKDCANLTCQPGSFCADMTCVADVCQGVVCSEGTRCAADGKCEPTACGSTACPDGQVCPASTNQCVSALCLGVSCDSGSACWSGGCFSKTGPDGKPCPAGELNIAGSCRATGAAADCGAVSCPSGFTCTSGACIDGDCTGVSCQSDEGCFGGVCYPTSDPANGPCDAGELYIGGACRATNGDQPALCGSDYCAAGYVCEDGSCFDAKCYGVTCPPGQACTGGHCASMTAPDGGACPPGTLWVDNACTPEPPITGCGEGCVPDQNGLCVPPECVAGGCGQICGGPSCYSFCKANEACDLDGTCHALCSACPTGFACASGNAPPCVPQDCLQLPCAAGMHCVDVGSGPTCEPIDCNGVPCRPNEACVSGTCTDMTCAKVQCPSDQTCYYGTCYPKCCPEGGQCSDDTMCYTPPGSSGPGTPVTKDCATQGCPSGTVCVGQTCEALGHTPPCQITGLQPLYCSGLDTDCNGTVDDYVFYPSWSADSTHWGIFPSWDSSDQYLVDREPCSNTGNEDDWNKLGVFDDGYNVYLMRFDADPASPKPPNPATRVSSSGPAGMSSCIRIDMPCAKFMATTLNLKIHGTGAVKCARYIASGITCSGNCYAPYVHVYIRSSTSAHWVDIGDRSNPKNWGDWFQPWLDGNYLHVEDLTDQYWHPRQVESVLICRDMADNSHASVGIDGVNVIGCCAH